MKQSDIEQLIDKKIAEAKLEVSEKRLRFLITLGGAGLIIFGIILPIFLTINSTSRLESQFKELAGTQLRRPMVECFSNGANLNDLTFDIPIYTEKHFIEVKNTGDAIANGVRLLLFIDYHMEVEPISNGTGWRRLSFVEEPNYKYAFEFPYSIDFLDPKESKPIPLSIWTSEKNTGAMQAYLKVYYGQPEPTTYRFRINLIPRNQ